MENTKKKINLWALIRIGWEWFNILLTVFLFFYCLILIPYRWFVTGEAAWMIASIICYAFLGLVVAFHFLERMNPNWFERFVDKVRSPLIKDDEDNDAL